MCLSNLNPASSPPTGAHAGSGATGNGNGSGSGALLVSFELLSYFAYCHFVIYSNLCIKIENGPLQVIMHPWYFKSDAS
jgi:hypothetical protein